MSGLELNRCLEGNSSYFRPKYMYICIVLTRLSPSRHAPKRHAWRHRTYERFIKVRQIFVGNKLLVGSSNKFRCK